MTARLVHALWMSRHGAGRDLMPVAQWAEVERQTPEAVVPAVRFPVWGQLCFACFWDCSTERALGFGGVGPIPFTRILEWGKWKRLDGTDLRTLVEVVRLMDAKYLEIEAARAKAKDPAHG